MTEARPRSLMVTLTGCAIVASAALAALAACSSPSPSQMRSPSRAQQLRVEEAAHALTMDARRYEVVEPSVTVPLNWVSWHREWIKPRPEFADLLAGFWRWHRTSRGASTADARTRDAENAYRLAIGQWVGDQANMFWMVVYCAPYGPGTERIQACWETELHRHQKKWLADDVALRRAYAGMSGKMTKDYPIILPRAGRVAG
jgi:hypothetical protein